MPRRYQRKPAVTRPCSICGQGFQTSNPTHTSCSPACQRVRYLRYCRAWYAAHREQHVRAVVEARRRRKGRSPGT